MRDFDFAATRVESRPSRLASPNSSRSTLSNILHSAVQRSSAAHRDRVYCIHYYYSYFVHHIEEPTGYWPIKAPPPSPFPFPLRIASLSPLSTQLCACTRVCWCRQICTWTWIHACSYITHTYTVHIGTCLSVALVQ